MNLYYIFLDPKMLLEAQQILLFSMLVVLNYLNKCEDGDFRQWQELFYKGNYSEVSLKNPNFQKLSDGFGIPSLKAINKKEAKEAIKEARAHQGPFLVEFVVEAEENVFPMVPAGAGIDEMVVSKEDIP